MLIRSFFLIPIIIFCNSLFGQVDYSEYKNVAPLSCNQFKEAYKEYKLSKEIQRSEKFLIKCPKNFNETYLIFSYTSGCLNDSAIFYANSISEALSQVPVNYSFERVIGFCSGGKYEIDGISTIQLIGLLYFSNDEFLTYLNNKTKSEIEQFVNFVLDIKHNPLFLEKINLIELKEKYPVIFQASEKKLKFE